MAADRGRQASRQLDDVACIVTPKRSLYRRSSSTCRHAQRSHSGVLPQALSINVRTKTRPDSCALPGSFPQRSFSLPHVEVSSARLLQYRTDDRLQGRGFATPPIALSSWEEYRQFSPDRDHHPGTLSRKITKTRSQLVCLW